MNINIKLFNDYLKYNKEFLPKFSKVWDAWIDVRSMIDVSLPPKWWYKIPLGFWLELPEGYFARIEWRSGYAVKFGIDTIGNIIDSNYRWEIHAILMNNSNQLVEIRKWDRIAQMIIQKYEICNFNVVEHLSETNRGIDWFWSTGSL